MTPLDRVILVLIGGAVGLMMVAVVAYAAPILRWQAAMLDRIVALFS